MKLSLIVFTCVLFISYSEAKLVNDFMPNNINTDESLKIKRDDPYDYDMPKKPDAYVATPVKQDQYGPETVPYKTTKLYVPYETTTVYYPPVYKTTKAIYYTKPTTQSPY